MPAARRGRGRQRGGGHRPLPLRWEPGQADVGADPGAPAVPLEAFHRFLADRQRRRPHCLNATSTRDSERSEDVRARLAAATELGAHLRRLVERWNRQHAALATTRSGWRSPDRLEELQLYETATGVWPFEPLAPTPYGDDRRRTLLRQLQAFSTKAAREVTRRSSWTDPDDAHEAAVHRFLAYLLTSNAGDRFVSDVDRLVQPLGPAGDGPGRRRQARAERGGRRRSSFPRALGGHHRGTPWSYPGPVRGPRQGR